MDTTKEATATLPRRNLLIGAAAVAIVAAGGAGYYYLEPAHSESRADSAPAPPRCRAPTC